MANEKAEDKETGALAKIFVSVEIEEAKIFRRKKNVKAVGT